MRTLLIILTLAMGVFSCSNDKDLLNYDNTTFVFIETISHDDYFGDSKLLVNEDNQTSPIKISNERIHYQVLGTKIIYKDGSDIVEFNSTTHQTQIIASFPNTPINSFHVSPDNEYLAFSDYEDIFLVELESGTVENITENLEGDFRNPKWSPNGNSILARNGVLIVRPGDNGPTITGNFKIFSLSQQTFQDIEMFDQFAYPGSAEWSPDSKIVIYEQYQAVFTFDVENEQLKRITSEEVVATNPKFSKNGTMISYFSSDQSDNGNNWQNFLTIYTIENQTSKVTNHSYSYDASWENDSTAILYCTENGIFLYNLETESIQILIETGESKYLHSTQFLE